MVVILFKPDTKVYCPDEVLELEGDMDIHTKPNKEYWNLSIGDIVHFRIDAESKEKREVKFLGYDNESGRGGVFLFTQDQTHVIVDALTQGEQII